MIFMNKKQRKSITNTIKVCTILLMVLISVLFTSCGIKKIQDETRLSKEVEKESTQVFDYLKNEDIKSLSDLFCQNQKDNSDIEEKWKIFYESIDGKILAYDKLSCTETMRTFSDGKLTYLVFRIEYSDVKTDTGRIYEKLIYSTTAKDIDDSNEEGISNFILLQGEDENGYPIAITVD